MTTLKNWSIFGPFYPRKSYSNQVTSYTKDRLHLLFATYTGAHWVKDLNHLLYNFLLKGKDKVTRASTINNYEEGCIKMVDIETLIKSFRLSWLERMFSNNSGMQPFKFRRVCGVCSGELWLARKNNCLLSSIFQQRRVALGKWCIGSQKGHPRTPGMEFFCSWSNCIFPLYPDKRSTCRER